MLRSLVVVLTLVFGIGCSGPAEPFHFDELEPAPAAIVRPSTVALCIASDVPEPGEVLRAIDLWNAALTPGLWIDPMMADECAGPGPRVTVAHDCGGEAHAACALGGIYDTSPEIHFDQLDRVKGKIFAITLHEIGHTLGSGHIEGTFMASKYVASMASTSCIDAQVAAEVSAVLGFEVAACVEP